MSLIIVQIYFSFLWLLCVSYILLVQCNGVEDRCAGPTQKGAYERPCGRGRRLACHPTERPVTTLSVSYECGSPNPPRPTRESGVRGSETKRCFPFFYAESKTKLVLCVWGRLSLVKREGEGASRCGSFDLRLHY